MKPTRPKFSEKTRLKDKISTTAKPTKKTYSTRAYTPKFEGGEHHSRRKVLRSTALPPSTTPLSTLIKDTKYSAKFVEKKSYNLEASTTEKVFKVLGKSAPKNLEASLIQVGGDFRKQTRKIIFFLCVVALKEDQSVQFPVSWRHLYAQHGTKNHD